MEKRIADALLAAAAKADAKATTLHDIDAMKKAAKVRFIEKSSRFLWFVSCQLFLERRE